MQFKPSVTHKTKGTNTSQMLLLSLFLLLLAFFIVLSTMIEYDMDKISRMKKGLQDAFIISKDEGTAGDLDKGSDVGKAVVEAFGRVEELVRVSMGVVSLQKFNNGSVMVITVEANDLLNADHTSLDSLATLLSYSEHEDVRYELEALYGLGEQVSTASEEKRGLAIERLGEFARNMTKFALPTHSMSIGLMRGKEDMVDLIIYAHRKDKAHIEFNPSQIKRGFGGMSSGGAL